VQAKELRQRRAGGSSAAVSSGCFTDIALATACRMRCVMNSPAARNSCKGSAANPVG
jgi:hypothetical protein